MKPFSPLNAVEDRQNAGLPLLAYMLWQLEQIAPPTLLMRRNGITAVLCGS
jgi:hypothetical protein